eukprot:scaffold14882_cov102-Skeletonema_marinoi.AAC.5
MYQNCCQMWDTWRMIMVHILFVQRRCHAYQIISASHPYYNILTENGHLFAPCLMHTPTLNT